MKKIFQSIIFALILLPATFAYSSEMNNTELLNDMKTHAEKYILYGGFGTGALYFIDRDSVAVHKYDPPNYIIAFQMVCRINPTRQIEKAYYGGIKRYAYNYDTHSIYEEKYIDGQPQWIYIEEEFSHGKGIIWRDWAATMAGAELAFYIAYNMPFYDEIKTKYAMTFINNSK